MTQVMVSVTPGMNWLGPWSATTAYAPTNVVSFAGSSYLCIAANTNQQPPNATYWNLVAASGAGGTPATSVTGPDAFGASPVVGVGTAFARQDHDHGLPSAPADLPLAGGTMSGAIAMGAHKITGMANGAAAQDAATFGQLPSVPGPAASVTGPDAFGASTVVGISAAYARQDHDHGLPASPFNWLGAWYSGTAYVAGDAVGSGGSSYICILGNTNEVPPNATYWNLLAQEGTAGVPATSVTGPDAFGASAVVGVGTDFARQDHGHGLPAAPADIPLSTVTAAGDLIQGTGSGAVARLALGTLHYMLAAGATAVGWVASAVSTLTTAGDLLYASAANTLARLGIGVTGQVLTVVSGAPAWSGGTVNGGPPSGSGAYAGEQIQDTKYGVVWWWDGSAWHANGPGLIKAEMYRNAAWTPANSGIAIPYDTPFSDPLSLITIASHYFKCPIAGDYRVAADVSQSTAGAATYIQLLCSGSSVSGSRVFAGSTSGVVGDYGGTAGTVRVSCAAGDELTILFYWSNAYAMQVGAEWAWAQFEFVSS